MLHHDRATRAVVFLSRPAAAAGSAPPRSPGNKGPPPPRAGRDLRGQRGAERPDAGGRRRRPRVARSLQVSSHGALLGVRTRSAARGQGAPGGAQQVLGGIKRCFSAAPGSLVGGEGSCLSVAPTQRLVAAGRSATPPSARSAPPSPFEIFQGEG